MTHRGTPQPLARIWKDGNDSPQIATALPKVETACTRLYSGRAFPEHKCLPFPLT